MERAMYDHVTRPLDALIPYAKNSRTHDDEQVAQIAGSIKEWGFTNPVLIDESDVIIAGHGRVLAARKLGLVEVPCVVLAGLSEEQKSAYVIADNKLALNAGWDMEMLSAQMQELDASGFDLSLIGFADTELQDLVAKPMEGLTDDDEVPEPPEAPVTVEGDVWILGNHRLMCGDSTNTDHVSKLMAGANADLLFTSPPYAQQRDYKEAISDWDSLMAGAFGAMQVKDGAQVLVNLGLVHEKGKVDTYWSSWLGVMESYGWPLFGWYVWDKGFGLPGNWNGRLAPAHEFIFHFAKPGKKAPARKTVAKKADSIGLKHGTGVRRADGSMSGITSPAAGLNTHKIADSVIRVTPHMARVNNTHPAMFPVELCERLYASYAKAGDCIYEPFSGSGTSIIACDKFGAHCYAMELAPEYVDIAVNRWQDYTGKQAVHENGTPFPQKEAA
jgi:DNA modification methylase